MTDVLPIHCPHCGFGNSMVEAYEDDYGYWKVGCGACGSHSGTLHPNHKPDAKRLVIVSWNRRPEEDRLRQLLSEAEKREREVRAKALGDAASAIFVMGAWSPHYEKLVPNTFDEGTSAAYEIVREIQGKAESALQSEER